MHWFNYVLIAVVFGSFSIQTCHGGITAIYANTTTSNSNPGSTGLTTTVNAQGNTDVSSGTLGTANYGSVSSNRPPGSTNNNTSIFNFNSQVTLQSGGMMTPTQYGVINIGGSANGTEFYDEERLTLNSFGMYAVVNGKKFTGDVSFSLAVGDKFLNLSITVPNFGETQYSNSFPGDTNYYPNGDDTVYFLSVDDPDGDYDGLTDEALYELAPPVPEPSSVVMLSIGGIGMGLAAWRRRRRVVE